MPLVVAFDLDMTLIDTVPGVAGTLTALGGELGVDLPVAELTARLGPPLDVLLDGHLPAEVMAGAVDRFRELYVDHAIHTVTTLDGAVESIAAVRRHGGRVVVVTGKYEPNARRHVEHLALDVDHVAGLVVGASARRRRSCGRVPRSWSATTCTTSRGRGRPASLSVSVLTGGCTEEELRRGRHRRRARRPHGVPRLARRVRRAQEHLGA